MTSPTLPQIFAFIFAFLTFFTSTASAIGSGCFKTGAFLRKEYVDQIIHDVCFRDLQGWIGRDTYRSSCRNVEDGFPSFVHSERMPGSYYFETRNLLGVDTFMNPDGCVDMMNKIKDQCERGGEFEPRGTGFDWNFILDPNVARC